MKTDINHLERKATRLIQLAGLEEKVTPLLPQTLTIQGFKLNVVFIGFKGDKEEAAATAKDLMWTWEIMDDQSGKEFIGYTIQFELQDDSPVIGFYKEEQLFAIDESDKDNVPKARGEKEGIQPNATLTTEEAAQKLVQMSGQESVIDRITLLNPEKGEELFEIFGDKRDVVSITFNDANKQEAGRAAKELFWWNFTKGKEFAGYNLDVEMLDGLDIPIIYFYRE